MTPIRYSVAAVIRRWGEDDEFLAVQRPPDDERLPDAWGLPAVSLRPGELPEAGLRRVGREKLGVELEPLRLIGIRSMDRGDYELILMDIEAGILAGDPSVFAAKTRSTRYVAQRWTADLGLLRDAARRGSLCCRILLEESGVGY